ncbi:MAG TPA: hypothetical protein VL943_04285 [Niabella sp.]|nr:hypothetical protein [Niabella sp.]
MIKKLTLLLLTSICTLTYGQNVLPTSGNVGIGTTNPRVPLDVGRYASGGSLSTVLARLAEGDTQDTGTVLGIRGWETRLPGYGGAYGGKSFSIEHFFYGKLNSAINFYRGESMVGGYITFATYNGTEKMRITPSGNVGIGTTTPNEKLAVNGNIIAKAIKVQTISTSWPDYVFLPSYQLQSLADVEAHIKEKGHLPEVPSAEEIQKNEGYELSKMDATLLKKIEELTLYAITMEKEIKSLKSESVLLKEENRRLKDNVLQRLEQLEKQPAKAN